MASKREEQKERDALMIQGLRQAIENGFQMSSPGIHPDVRKEFPGWFAQEDDTRVARESEEVDVEIASYPLASYGNHGVWVQAWVWVDYEIKE